MCGISCAFLSPHRTCAACASLFSRVFGQVFLEYRASCSISPRPSNKCIGTSNRCIATSSFLLLVVMHLLLAVEDSLSWVIFQYATVVPYTVLCAMIVQVMCTVVALLLYNIVIYYMRCFLGCQTRFYPVLPICSYSFYSLKWLVDDLTFALIPCNNSGSDLWKEEREVSVRIR